MIWLVREEGLGKKRREERAYAGSLIEILGDGGIPASQPVKSSVRLRETLFINCSKAGVKK